MNTNKILCCLTTGVVCLLACIVQTWAAGADIPDISGVWQRYGMRFNAANAAAGENKYIPSAAADPPLKAEYMKEWLEQREVRRKADEAGTPLTYKNYVNCIGDGMPSMMMAMFPIEFLQSKGQITIIEEAFTQVRRIYLDQPQVTLDDIEPGFYGHSVGHWQDGVLNIDTIGVKDTVRYHYIPHSKDMRIMERIRLVAPDILWDEITMIDPAYLTKPYEFVYAYKRMTDYEMQEYICEGNREYLDEQGHQQIRLDN